MHGSLNLTVSSPAQSFVEPLIFSEVKSYLGIPERSPADLYEDDAIESLIIAAREQAEILQGRDLVRKQWDLSLDCFPGGAIELRDPLASVDLIQYRDSTGVYASLVEGAGYIVDSAKHPGVVMPPWGLTWPSFEPWPTSAVVVRFTSGLAPSDLFWANAGHRIKNGMKMLISAWYNNRLPFEIGASAIQEYPYAVTACLGYGALGSVF